ncbi:MFS transporter [Streptomyces bambusae]|uniref:MFS transporter n=1 Tax=Streptomyces bambusae TaxID=1550616 RepID=A0ABS6ZE10_9ACTN|nr:MFS transporter [Streptomyces bambusae]MBW5485433.1 MFS transporter [Streptomyces bambusae]
MSSRRPLTAVLAANTVSVAGSSLTLIGVPWFVLQTTGSAGRAGIVAFCATVPVVVAALVGGPVIDRIGRRRVSVASDAVCGLAVGAIPLLHATGLLEFWLLCALMAVSGLVHTPGLTARSVLLPNLAEHAGTSLPRAASLYDAVYRGARMIGAALAGVLIVVLGAETVLLLDAATFAVSAALVQFGVRGVPAAEPQPGNGRISLAGYRAELREGWVFLTGNRLLLGITCMVMLTNGMDQGWGSVLLPVHGRQDLGGAAAVGLLVALFGGCALLGALLYGAWGERLPRRAVFTAAFLLSGAPRYVFAGLTDTTLPLAVTMALAGLGAGMLNPILTTLIFELVPEELRSRVSGVTMAGCELFMPLGGLAAGLLVEGFGITRALLLFGGVYLLTTLAPVLFPAWRAMDRRAPVAAATGGTATDASADPDAGSADGPISRTEPAPPGSARAGR